MVVFANSGQRLHFISRPVKSSRKIENWGGMKVFFFCSVTHYGVRQPILNCSNELLRLFHFSSLITPTRPRSGLTTATFLSQQTKPRADFMLRRNGPTYGQHVIIMTSRVGWLISAKEAMHSVAYGFISDRNYLLRTTYSRFGTFVRHCFYQLHYHRSANQLHTSQKSKSMHYLSQ